MNQLTACFPLQTVPQCPVCRDNLIHRCFTFWRGVAFCVECSSTVPDAVMAEIVDLCWGGKHNEYWSVALGVFFFTPGNHAQQRLPAHLMLPRVLLPESIEPVDVEA